MLLRDESGGNLFYWPGGTRHRGGVSLIWALMLNCGNLSQRWQEKGTSREPARLTVSTRCTGTDKLVVAGKLL